MSDDAAAKSNWGKQWMDTDSCILIEIYVNFHASLNSKFSGLSASGNGIIGKS